MQAQFTAAITTIARHPKTLHARNVANLQAQYATRAGSHLAHQTGHYATTNDMLAVVFVVVVLVVLGGLRAILR